MYPIKFLNKFYETLGFDHDCLTQIVVFDTQIHIHAEQTVTIATHVGTDQLI